MSATEVPKIVQLIFNMELLAISCMCKVGSEHKVYFVAFLRLNKNWPANTLYTGPKFPEFIRVDMNINEFTQGYLNLPEFT